MWNPDCWEMGQPHGLKDSWELEALFPSACVGVASQGCIFIWQELFPLFRVWDNIRSGLKEHFSCSGCCRKRAACMQCVCGCRTYLNLAAASAHSQVNLFFLSFTFTFNAGKCSKSSGKCTPSSTVPLCREVAKRFTSLSAALLS